MHTLLLRPMLSPVTCVVWWSAAGGHREGAGPEGLRGQGQHGPQLTGESTDS